MQGCKVEPFVNFLQFIFGHPAENTAAFLTCAGAIIGAVMGLFVARIVPHPKLCLALLLAFIAGVIIGGTAIYRPGKNIFELSAAVWEDNAASERASAYLESLRLVDRGMTNDIYMARFQNTGREVLTNYLRETENQMQNLKNTNYIDFVFTNSATYHMVQKYLAAH